MRRQQVVLLSGAYLRPLSFQVVDALTVPLQLLSCKAQALTLRLLKRGAHRCSERRINGKHKPRGKSAARTRA
jgi:hypothetical protein